MTVKYDQSLGYYYPSLYPAKFTVSQGFTRTKHLAGFCLQNS